MCNVKIKVQCPHCESPKVVKNGKKSTGKQNFLCKDCRKQFQFVYTNKGSDPKVQRQIKSSLLHGSGIRDCSAVFSVSQRCVLNLILRLGQKVKIQPKRNQYDLIQLDEFYSFVGHKGKKVWIFYAYAPQTKEILAFTMGKRDIRQIRFLLLRIKPLRIKINWWCTDHYEGFKTVLNNYPHLIGKEFTKAIEGRNTCIRARLARFQRRSTKFSKKLLFQWFLFLIFVQDLNSKPSYIF